MWTRIPDDHVRHIWVDPDGTGSQAVSPSYYAERGTPACDDDSAFSGDDMTYVCTEVQLPGMQQPELDEATALLRQVIRGAKFSMPHGLTAYVIDDEVMGKIRAFVEQRK